MSGLRNALVLTALVVVAAALVWYRLAPRPAGPPAAEELPPLPDSPTRFLNTGPDARYVGVAACAKCHDAQHRTYLRTAHSRALGDVDVEEEPPGDGFFHQAS